MKIKDSKGITLVALAVTIIVIIIMSATIAVNVNPYFERKRKTNFESDLTRIKERVEQYYAENKSLPILNKYTNNGDWKSSITETDGEDYYIIDLNKIGELEDLTLNFGEDGFKEVSRIETSVDVNDITDIYIINEKNHVVYYPEGIEFEEEKLYRLEVQVNQSLGSFSKIKIDGSWNEEEKVNTPKIKDTGLIAVYWDEDGEEKELTNDSPASEWQNWYDYNQNKWANAVTKDNRGNVTGYFVWIPRFAYKITSGLGKSDTGEIEIQFLQGKTNVNAEGKEVSKVYPDMDNNIEYMSDFVIHPAFTNGKANNFANGEWDEEIEGFWMAKFEAGYAGNAGEPSTAKNSNVKYSTIYSWDGNTNVDVTSIYYGERVKDETSIKYPVFNPNRPSVNYIGISDAYDLCKDIKRGTSMYGLSNVDSHLTKNSEWGAVAYLTHSKYGRDGEEVRVNNVSVNGENSVWAVTGYGASTNSGGEDTSRNLATLTTEGQNNSWKTSSRKTCKYNR